MQSALNFAQPAPAVTAAQQVSPAPPPPLEQPPRLPVEPRRIIPEEIPWLAFKERETPQAQDSGDASGASVGEEGPGDGAGETRDDTDPALGYKDDNEEAETGVAPAAKPKYSGRWKRGSRPSSRAGSNSWTQLETRSRTCPWSTVRSL